MPAKTIASSVVSTFEIWCLKDKDRRSAAALSTSDTLIMKYINKAFVKGANLVIPASYYLRSSGFDWSCAWLLFG